MRNIITRKQGIEVAPALALAPFPVPTLAPVPARPASAATVAQRVEGRNAKADHDPHIVPDTLAGVSQKFYCKFQILSNNLSPPDCKITKYAVER